MEQDRKRRKNMVYMDAVRKMLDDEESRRPDKAVDRTFEPTHAASAQELPRDGIELSHRRRFEEAAQRLPTFQMKNRELPVAPHLRPFERALERDSSVPLPRPVGGKSTIDLGGGGGGSFAALRESTAGGLQYETPVKGAYYHSDREKKERVRDGHDTSLPALPRREGESMKSLFGEKQPLQGP